LVDQRHASSCGVSLVYHGRAAHTIKCVPEPTIDISIIAVIQFVITLPYENVVRHCILARGRCISDPLDKSRNARFDHEERSRETVRSAP